MFNKDLKDRLEKVEKILDDHEILIGSLKQSIEYLNKKINMMHKKMAACRVNRCANRHSDR